MKAKITAEGILTITPETESEVYAVKKWYEENPSFPDKSKMFIETEIRK